MSDLYVDANQGRTDDDRVFGFIGSNDEADYQGFFFTWTGSLPVVTTESEIDEVVASLDPDTTHDGDPPIDRDDAERVLRRHLELVLRRQAQIDC